MGYPRDVVTINLTPTALAASANQTSAAVFVKGCVALGLQAIWTGLDAADGVFKLQISLDGTNWDDYPSSSVTAATTPLSKVWDLYLGTSVDWVRVNYAKGSNTAGTFTVIGRLHRGTP